MLSSRGLPLPFVLVALLVATGLSLLAATHLPAGLRGSTIAVLGLAKIVLVVRGFMRLQRESSALTGALIAYAALICLLAGARIALAGVS